MGPPGDRGVDGIPGPPVSNEMTRLEARFACFRVISAPKAKMAAVGLRNQGPKDLPAQLGPQASPYVICCL